MLQIKNLNISFGNNTVVSNLSFSIQKNKILGIVGESGSGKSVSSLAILGLLPKNKSEVTGSIIFNNNTISK